MAVTGTASLTIAEMREFAGLTAAEQRYIRRSLDIGLDRDDAMARWSRDVVEAASIRAQARLYRGLPALRQRPDAKRRRDLERCRRRLEAQGTVSVSIAREPEAFRLALEDFFILEASGWKGQARSALISDRFRAAFAREALNALAAKDKARIFSLRLDNEAIASLVVLVDDGEAYAWKSAYDERFAKVSPGHLIMAEATRVLIADPTVQRADSCAVPDHFVMNRFWHDRIEIGTLVVGLHPGMQDAVERAAKGLENRKRTQNRVRILRQRLQAAFGG